MNKEFTTEKEFITHDKIESEKTARITNDYYLDFSERGKIEITNTKVVNFFRIPSLLQGIIIYSGMYFILIPLYLVALHLMQVTVFDLPKDIDFTPHMMWLYNTGAKVFIIFHGGILLYLNWVSYRKKVKIPWNYPFIYMEGVFLGLLRKESARKLVDLLSKLFVLDTTQYSGYDVDERLKANQIIPNHTYLNFQQFFIPLYAFILFLIVGTIINLGMIIYSGTQSEYLSTAATFLTLHINSFAFSLVVLIFAVDPLIRKLHKKREVVFDEEERS